MPLGAPTLLSFRCHNVGPRHHRSRPRNACPSSPSRTCSRSTVRAVGHVVLSPLLRVQPSADCPRPRSVSEQFVRTGSVCEVGIVRTEAYLGVRSDVDQRRAFGRNRVGAVYAVMLGPTLMQHAAARAPRATEIVTIRIDSSVVIGTRAIRNITSRITATS